MDRAREENSAMALARRAYLYGLHRVMFGGGFNAQSIQMVFSTETIESLRWLKCMSESLDEDMNLKESVSFRSPDALHENIACVKTIMKQGYREELKTLLVDSHSRLFRVPGSSYVRPWESPYVGTKDTLFQGSTLDVRKRFHKVHLKLSAEGRFPDDHLATILEYQARMSESAYHAYSEGNKAEAQRILFIQSDMLNTHVFTWIGDFVSEVKKKDVTGIFSAFASGLEVFCAIDHQLCLMLEAQLGIATEDKKEKGVRLHRQSKDFIKKKAR